MSVLSPRGLARLSARHPWTMLGRLGDRAGGADRLRVALGPNITNEVAFTSDEEAQVARNTLEGIRGKEPLFEQIVVRHETLTVDDPEFVAFVGRVFDDVQALSPEHIEFATSFYAGPTEGDRSLVSADGRTTIVQAEVRGRHRGRGRARRRALRDPR